MAPKLFVTVGSALGLAIGIALIILAAVLAKSYYVFLSLVPMFLLPFPLMFCGPKENSFEEETFLEMCGHFLTGVLVACLFGTVATMAVVKAITTLALILSLIGMFVMMASVIWFSKADRDSSY